MSLASGSLVANTAMQDASLANVFTAAMTLRLVIAPQGAKELKIATPPKILAVAAANGFLMLPKATEELVCIEKMGKIPPPDFAALSKAHLSYQSPTCFSIPSNVGDCLDLKKVA